MNYKDATKMEVHCNPSKPATSIEIVAGPTDIPQQLRFPLVELKLVDSFARFEGAPDKYEGFAIMGIVTGLSDPFVFDSTMVKRSEPGGEAIPQRYSKARWLYLRNHAEPRDLAVKLNFNSQPTKFNTLKVGDIVLLTNMRLRTLSAEPESHADLGSSLSFRLSFVETTTWSQLTKNKRLASIKHPFMTDLLTWVQKLDLGPFASFEKAVNVFRNFYFRVHSKAVYKNLFAHSEFQKAHLSDISNIIHSMRFKERRMVTVRGRIHSLEISKITQPTPLQMIVLKVNLRDIDKGSPLQVFAPYYSVLNVLPVGLLDIVNSFKATKIARDRMLGLLGFLPRRFVQDHNDELMAASNETRLIVLLNEILPREVFEFALDINFVSRNEDEAEVVLTNIFPITSEESEEEDLEAMDVS